MSGVRNLRAMFEQKGESGLPDDRGRSPGPGGFASPSPSASPRPLSKVRSSFITVLGEDGRVGLRREPSRDSASASSRRLSDETDTTTPQPVSERNDVFSDNMASNGAAFRTNLSHQPIPESPIQDTPVELSPKKEPKAPLLEPNANPDKTTDEEDPRAHMITGDPTDASASRVGSTLLGNGIGDSLNATTPNKVNASKPTTLPKPAPKAITEPLKATTKPVTRAPKSPMTVKAPGAKESTKANGPTGSLVNAKKATTTKSLNSKASAIDLSKANTGFVKPKPKSPTRPVKLPSSLMAPTASSAQKLGSSNTASNSRQSLSRASGNTLNIPSSSVGQRAPSRNSVTASNTAAGEKTLKHKGSSVGRQRPSLGPPPKTTAKEQPAPKRESQVDRSFLERMMRPTASSSSKTSDKAPVTPPRKQSVPAKKTEVNDVERNAKKVAARIQASSDKGKTAKDTVKPVANAQPTAQEIAPAVAQAETAQAAIEDAKLSTDTAETPIVEEATLEIEPTLKDVAAFVAQEETAEAIVETAKVLSEEIVEPIVQETEPQAAEEPAVNPESIKVVDQAGEAVDSATAIVPGVTEEAHKVEDIEDVIQPVEVKVEQQLTAADAPIEEASDVTEPETGSAAETTSDDVKTESSEIETPAAKSTVQPSGAEPVEVTEHNASAEAP